MPNIRLEIAYNGTAYIGWQSQKNGRTVQDAIEEAIYKTTAKKVSLLAAGRTDTGVHALGQVANFNIDHELPPEKYTDALNYYLPKDILIKSSAQVEDSFHARFDAQSKRYRYLIGLNKSAHYYNYRWEIREALDLTMLRQASDIVTGEHDFAPFCVVSSRKENNTCSIYHSRWHRWGDLLIYEIRGNRFLHSMIRSLVGSMVNLARTDPDKNPQNLTLAQFEDIILNCTEKRMTFTAPACGLYLVSVRY